LSLARPCGEFFGRILSVPRRKEGCPKDCLVTTTGRGRKVSATGCNFLDQKREKGVSQNEQVQITPATADYAAYACGKKSRERGSDELVDFM